MDDRELSRKQFLSLTTTLDDDGLDVTLRAHDLALREKVAGLAADLLAARLHNEQLTREALELRETVERLTKERDEALKIEADNWALFERQCKTTAAQSAELQRLRDALMEARHSDECGYWKSICSVCGESHNENFPDPPKPNCPEPFEWLDGPCNCFKRALSGSPEPAPPEDTCKTCGGKELMPNGETCTDCLGYDSAATAEGKEKTE